MPKLIFTRAFAGIGLGAALVLAAPLAASAHVTITPDKAEAGGWTYVTFRVPNESESAGTTSLEVHLPTDTPFTSVSYQPTPGWTGTITTETLPEPVDVAGNTITEAPTTVRFAADPGSSIEPGQFQTFTIALGPVPDVGHIVIPATQTYSDGDVVEWEATPEQVAEDETREPAPVLWVNEAAPADGHSDAAMADHGDNPDVTAGSGTGSAAGDATAADSRSGLAVGLSIAALVLGAAGVVLGAVAVGRRRRALP